jgi:hypothetical protein
MRFGMDTCHCHANHQPNVSPRVKRSRVALGNGTVSGGLTGVGLPQETVLLAGTDSIPAGSIMSAASRWFERTPRPALDGLVSGGSTHVGLPTETFRRADCFGQVGGFIPPGGFGEAGYFNKEIASSICFANGSFPSFN